MPKPHCFVKSSLGKRRVQQIDRVGIDTTVKGCSLAPLPEPRLLSNPRRFICCYRNNRKLCTTCLPLRSGSLGYGVMNRHLTMALPLPPQQPPCSLQAILLCFSSNKPQKMLPPSPWEETLHPPALVCDESHYPDLLSDIFKALLLLFITGSCKHSPRGASALCAWHQGWALPFQWRTQSMSKSCRI